MEHEATYPLRCPACHHDSGWPYSATADNGDIIAVAVRCANCGHTWRIERWSPQRGAPDESLPLRKSSGPRR